MASSDQSSPADRLAAAFDDKAEAWQRYTETPLGRLRQELTLYNLVRRIKSRGAGQSILDAGAGSGGYALALAKLGHRVTLLDVSPAMLAIARAQIAATDPTLIDQVEFVCGGMEQLDAHCSGQRFDVVLAHTLLEYMHEPWQMLADLVSRLTSEGILSLLITNPAAMAFRHAVARGDPTKALEALDATVAPADLFGVPRATLSLSAAQSALSAAGIVQVEHWGVRIFADYGDEQRLEEPAHWEAVWALEVAAAGMDPYRGIARYHHLLGTRSPDLARRT